MGSSSDPEHVLLLELWHSGQLPDCTVIKIKRIDIDLHFGVARVLSRATSYCLSMLYLQVGGRK